MRRMLTLLLLALTLFASPGLAGDGDGFEQYRIPDHHAHQYTLDFSSAYFRSSRQTPGTWSTSSDLTPRFSAGGRWIADTDARQWELRVVGTFNGERSLSRYHNQAVGVWDSRANNRSRTAVEQAYAAADLREYPSRAPFGFRVGAEATVNDQQGWLHSEERFTTSAAGQTFDNLSVTGESHWTYGQFVGAAAGAGWGRVRDASSVHVARWLEQRWRRDGALTRELSAPARARLAQLLALRGDYDLAHDRPDKAFWRDVETLLREDGALASGHLDAYAANHARDPLPASSATDNVRLAGFWVGPRLVFTHIHQLVRTDHSSSTIGSVDGVAGPWLEERTAYRYTQHEDVVAGGLEAEWHRALGLRTQLDAWASADADVRGVRRRNDSWARVMARHWLGERWALGARLDQARAVVAEQYGGDSWSSYAAAALDYYVEDHWTVGASLRFQRQVNRWPFRTDYRSTNVVAGIGWNRGALDAPGLIAPVRPLD